MKTSNLTAAFYEGINLQYNNDVQCLQEISDYYAEKMKKPLKKKPWLPSRPQIEQKKKDLWKSSLIVKDVPDISDEKDQLFEIKAFYTSVIKTITSLEKEMFLAYLRARYQRDMRRLYRSKSDFYEEYFFAAGLAMLFYIIASSGAFKTLTYIKVFKSEYPNQDIEEIESMEKNLQKHRKNIADMSQQGVEQAKIPA